MDVQSDAIQGKAPGTNNHSACGEDELVGRQGTSLTGKHLIASKTGSGLV